MRDVGVENARLDVVEKHVRVSVSDVEECRVEILVEVEPGKKQCCLAKSPQDGCHTKFPIDKAPGEE